MSMHPMEDFRPQNLSFAPLKGPGSVDSPEGTVTGLYILG